METDKRNIVGHLLERGDPLSIWAAETIRHLRQQNAKLGIRSSQNELAKKTTKAIEETSIYRDMWRQNGQRVSSLLDVWRPVAMEIARIYGMGNQFHSINDINEYDKKLGVGSIYMKEFTGKGVRTVDVRDAVMAILKQVPKKSWFSRIKGK